MTNRESVPDWTQVREGDDVELGWQSNGATVTVVGKALRGEDDDRLWVGNHCIQERVFVSATREVTLDVACERAAYWKAVAATRLQESDRAHALIESVSRVRDAEGKAAAVERENLIRAQKIEEDGRLWEQARANRAELLIAESAKHVVPRDRASEGLVADAALLRAQLDDANRALGEVTPIVADLDDDTVHDGSMADVLRSGIERLRSQRGDAERRVVDALAVLDDSKGREVSCAGTSLDTDGCFAHDLAVRIRAALISDTPASFASERPAPRMIRDEPQA